MLTGLHVHRFGRLAVPLTLLVLPLFITTGATQQRQRRTGDSTVINQSDDPLLASFRFRSIGPASMGGRIDDIAVSESDPSIIYIGYAVGGVFKPENNGTTFEPVFETYPTASIGDIAIHPTNPNIVYVGTGEANNRQTTSFGDGIYKTTDGGKTFTNIGLKETQTIARIVIDPRNPETLYVAVPGHLFGPNDERGVYKTTDGGRTWNKVKFIDDDTGFNDIVLDPSNSTIVYASSYQRRRSGCCFNGGGSGSAIWKSLDAGKTWTKLAEHGLPPGTYGRIALDVSRSNPNVVYAQIEAGETGMPVRTAATDVGAATELTPAGAAAVNPPGGRAGAAGRPAEPGQAGAAGRAGQAGGAGRAGGAGQESEEGGGGRGGPSFDWCNNGGPSRGYLAGRGGGNVMQQPPAGWKPPELDPRRSGIYRSDKRQDHLRRGTSGREIARRRQDVRDARRCGRTQLAGSRRSARDLDRSEKSQAHHDRQRWRPRHQLGSGTHVGLRQHDGDCARVRRHGRHASTVLRVHRPSGQRELGRTERRARTRRHHELGLVRHRRRRRLLHGRRSHRLQQRDHRIAGRQHQSVRSAHGPRRQHSASCARCSWAGRSWKGRRGYGGWRSWRSRRGRKGWRGWKGRRGRKGRRGGKGG